MIEKFNALPPAQRAGVMVGIMAFFAFIGYFLLVSPELDRAKTNRNKVNQLTKEIDELQKHGSKEEQAALEAKQQALQERDRENRKMLPSEDEIPNFIDGIQADAKRLGLLVKRFDRQERERDDYYDSVPVKIELHGTFLQLTELLRMLSGPDRRIVNVFEMEIEKQPDDMIKLKKQVDESKPQLVDASGKAQKRNDVKSPEEQLMDRIEIAELARKTPIVSAKFTVYTFTWTGKPLPVDPQHPRPPKKKRHS